MKKRNPAKIIVIVVLIAALLGGGTFGAVRLAKNGGGEVNVYPVSAFSTDAEWMNTSETGGSVTTDRIQSVYLSDTQQITEIYVEEGQTVKAGDPILSFDTTLSDLALERQGIRVEQLKLDIENAEKQLETINTYRVGSPVTYSPTYSAPTYSSAPYMPYDRAPEATGTRSDPLIWLWNEDCVLDEAFFLRIAAIALANREAAREADEPDEPEIPDEPDEPDTPDIPDEPELPDEPETPDEPEMPDEPETPDESETPDETENSAEGEAAAAPEGASRLMSAVNTRALRHVLREADAIPLDSPPEPSELDDPNLYIVFETRDADAPEGDIVRVCEMVLSIDTATGDWAARLIEPSYDPGEGGNAGYDDYDYPIDTNVYYTADEIAQMKAEARQKLKDLRIELKTAELEYERLEYELSSGEVVSRIDGVVKTVRDPEEARAEKKPVLVVSGGGGYYVTAALGEFVLDEVAPGDTVSVMSWESYETYEGVITEISEYPDESGQSYYYGEGNQNVSLYPIKIFIDEDAELREGEYVSVTYNAGGGDGGLYLEMPFIRQDGGKSYVYTVGADGTLEKRYVRTGQNLWGSYIEILDGLTADEYVAFPYGRQTREGAHVRYAEADELWASAYGIG